MSGPENRGCEPYLGAQWNDGGLAGLFALNLQNPASTAGINIGCRLASRFSGCKLNLGANWNNGGLAGLFALNLNNPASNANINIGCRLATRSARNHVLTGAWAVRDLGPAFLAGHQPRRNTKRAGAASSRKASVAPALF